ncbi:hypothetical protein SDC9_150164 [bioreactor metagenome]|uniref:Uncharacterized protein n=1 Tax=bioreactor metagenome TaxID=1076179 RepID=A0A645EQY8_9ZZZZ
MGNCKCAIITKSKFLCYCSCRIKNHHTCTRSHKLNNLLRNYIDECIRDCKNHYVSHGYSILGLRRFESSFSNRLDSFFTALNKKKRDFIGGFCKIITGTSSHFPTCPDNCNFNFFHLITPHIFLFFYRFLRLRIHKHLPIL